MIGRTEAVKPWALVKWARKQAEEQQLTQLEAHLLLILSTYANREAKCWPSIGTLATDCGLKVRERKVRGRPVHTNRAVERGLARLQELGLIWREQAGRRAATTELLFAPSQEAEQAAPPHEAEQEAFAPSVETPAPSQETDEVPVRSTSRKENDQETLRPDGRERPSPDDDREVVRTAIRESLEGPRP